MEREDITKAEPGLLDNFRRRIVRPTDGPVEAIDQRIQLFGSDLVEASKIGHDTRAHLVAVVSKRLDQLKVLAVSCLGDASVHYVATLSPKTAFYE